MKKTLFTIAALALVGLSNAATVSLNLSPSSGNVAEDVNGLAPTDLTTTWQGTYQYGSLIGQVGFADSALKLQIGAVASQNNGNYAGVMFSFDDLSLESGELTFDIVKDTSWGANRNNFFAAISCDIFAYTEDGTALTIGTWTKSNLDALDVASHPYSESVSIALNIENPSEYTSYGVIFKAIDLSTVESAAGLGTQISNIVVSGTTVAVPEPATASLSLLGLGALMMRRRRA